jgi:hypothetical protein
MDPFDVFGTTPFGENGGLPSFPGMGGFANFPGLRPPRQERVIALPPLDPATEESLIAQIGGTAMTGLATLGNILDTPGSIVRGLLAGDGGRAIGGILDPSKRVYGTELMGMPRDTSLFSPEGVAGLGTEIALDPLTYLTFGASAVNKLGKAAKAAGVLPRTTRARIEGLAQGSEELAKLAAFTGKPVQELAGKPLGSVAKFMGANLGEGAGGLKFLDVAGAPFRAIGGYEPIARLGRGAAAMFDPPVQGTISKEVQPFARAAFHAKEKQLPAMMTDLVGKMRSLQDQGVPFDTLRPVGEQVNPAHYSQATQQIISNLSPEATAILHTVGGDIRALMDEMIAKEIALGGNVTDLKDDFAKYLTRHINAPAKGGLERGTRALGTFHPEQMAREDVFRNIPGGSDAINEIMQRDDLSRLAKGGSKDVAQMTLREEYLWRGHQQFQGMSDGAILQHKQNLKAGLMSDQAFAQLKQDEALLKSQIPNLQGQQLAQAQAQLTQYRQAIDLETQNRATIELIDNTVTKSKELSNKILEHGKRVLGKEKFFRDPVADIATRISNHVQSTTNMDQLHNLFLEHAVPASAGVSSAYAPKGFVTLDQAYAHVNMGKLSSATGFGKANDEAINQFNKRASGKLVPAGHAVSGQDVMVPRHVVEDAARITKVLQTPEAIEPFLKLFDQATNLFKMGNTFIWPAYHIRNLFSVLSQNMFTGTFGLADTAAARDLHFGRLVSGAENFPALKGMTRDQATKKIADTGIAYGLLGRDFGPQSDVVGRTIHDTMSGRLPGQLPGPGVKQAGPAEVLGKGIKQTFDDLGGAISGDAAARTRANPLNVAGVAANADLWAPAQAGRNIAAQIDEMGTMGSFINLLRKGYSLEAAAETAKAIHYRGAQFTGFESAVMRRMVPFYWWVRNNTAFITNQLFERPGGAYAQAYRAATRARGDEQGFIPPWLGTNAIIPLGEEDATGHQKFIGSLGLPFEDLPNTFSVTGTLGAMNPLIKGPLEMATGKQFFSGRDLADLHTQTGSTALDQIIYNSPLARTARYARQATDPRKSLTDLILNFGSGVRVTDVDMERAKDIAIRDFITNSLRGRPGVRTFESPYVRQEDIANLDPMDLLLLRLQSGRQQQFRQQQRG